MPKTLIFLLISATLSTAQIVPFLTPSPPEQNFSPVERYSAWSANILPGFGSILMGDKIGAITNFVLGGGGITLIIVSLYQYEDICKTYILIDDPNTKVEKCSSQITNLGNNLMTTGIIMWLSQLLIYNTYRSITYDKPGSVAYNKSGGFNVAFLPNRHGSFNSYLMYNKAF